MANLLLIFHVIVALGIVGLILIQQGKGAEMGASFGSGASQTVFGSSGSGNFFSKMTGLLAAVFFGTSLFLAISAKNQSTVVEGEEGLLIEAQEAEGIPTLENAMPTTNTDEGVPSLGSQPSVEEIQQKIIEASEKIEQEKSSQE